MKIVQVNDTFVPGRGIDRVIYEISKRMEAEVTVLASRIEYDLPGVEMVELSVREAVHPALWMIPKVKEYVKHHKDCAFHFHHMVLNWALAEANILCTFHGWSPERLDRSSFLKKRLRQRFLEMTARRYSLAPKVTAVNSCQLSFLERVGAQNPVHVPNGVDTEKFSPSNRDGGYMLFVGRLTDQKRPDELVRLAAQVGYPLHVIGDGPLMGKVSRLVEEINAPVSLLGKVSEKRLLEEYKNCSFFVSTSHWEGMTLTVPEAYACGKAVAVYNIPSMAEFPIGPHCSDFREMKKSVERLIEDEEHRAELGSMAREYAEKNLSWDYIAERYMELYGVE